MASSQNVIGSTIGMELSEVTDCRYQPTRTTKAIYSIDSQYFAVGKNAPKDEVGGKWRQHRDQFFAEKHSTVLWVCDMIGAEK